MLSGGAIIQGEHEMKPTAIVYTSNTGFTTQYARMLGERTGWKAYSLDEAWSALEEGSPVLYLGWLMASQVKGLKKAQKRFKICAVCGVCMGKTGSQLAEVRRANALPSELPVFTMQGGFDMKRLHGVYKFMMKIMGKTMGKKLAQKPDLSPEEREMLRLLNEGGSCVSEENLSGVLAWCREQK